MVEQARKAVTEHPIYFWTDLHAYVPYDIKTFYKMFPSGSPEHTEIATLMDVNRIKTKIGIRAKLYRSQKAGELLALYKLVATDEERKLLSMNYVDIQTDGRALPSLPPIIIQSAPPPDSEQR